MEKAALSSRKKLAWDVLCVMQKESESMHSKGDRQFSTRSHEVSTRQKSPGIGVQDSCNIHKTKSTSEVPA